MTSPDHRPDPSGTSALPRPGWAPFLVAGVRVVLRYRIDRASSPHGEGMTDALGYIESVDERSVTVMTPRGTDRVQRASVIAAKQVPPPPRRRTAAHETDPAHEPRP